MNRNQKQLIIHVMIGMDPETVINEESILKQVKLFSTLFPVTEPEENEVIALLHTRLAIRMDRGACVTEKNHVSWYYSAKKDLQTQFWDRYRQFLIKNKEFAPDVVNSLDASTDEMMDLLGNPSLDADFHRKGLVIGDIQSGKTATYTALINKAADAGYRIIILLTGTIEKLRKQTQGRLDEGFVGLDSTAFIQDRNNVLVGVGNIDSSISGWAVTSTTSDFNKSTAEKLSGQLSGIKSPVLFVLKKNKSILEKLEQWLKLYNANQVSKTCPLPMLLIDDEADSASVNTRTEDDPTIINANIRKLLKLFSKANYVGFTATPFANIFIDPESEHEMLHDDLFPKDFIYALEAPSNYIGARSVFSDEGAHSHMLKSNDDCEDYLPEKHHKDFIPSELPASLKQAISSFFIANAVRDLRGDTKCHRSMLINVSRFIAVHEEIRKAVDIYVRDLQREIKNYHLIGEKALEYDAFSFVKSVFDEHFRVINGFDFTWEQIQLSLHKSIASIIVKTVNGKNASSNLNYDENKEEGLRLIAIGGFSLSRGLTLEGLSTSYFFRNSKMYDTLMQMGRWFGYRDGYQDICQIWMSENAISWYKYISVASDELRREVVRMKEQNKTPKDFGLRVRSDIITLLVTARNRMRSAEDYTWTISLNGKMVETPYLHVNKEILEGNLQHTENWIKVLAKDGYILDMDGGLALKHPQIKNVPKKYICEYISSFKSHYLNMDFQTDNLVASINEINDGLVDNWDIVIAEGKGEISNFCGKNIGYVTRGFAVKLEAGAIQISGKNSRLGDKNYAKGGLTKQQVEEIENAEKEYQNKTGRQDTFSQDTYFSSGIKRNPLIVIYPVELSLGKIKNSDFEKEQNSQIMEIASKIPVPVVGLSIGIPKIDGKENKIFKYKINKIKAKEIYEFLGSDDNYEEDAGETLN